MVKGDETWFNQRSFVLFAHLLGLNGCSLDGVPNSSQYGYCLFYPFPMLLLLCVFYVVLFLLGSIEMFSSVKEVLGYLSLLEMVVVVSVTCLKLEKGEGKKVI